MAVVEIGAGLSDKEIATDNDNLVSGLKSEVDGGVVNLHVRLDG